MKSKVENYWKTIIEKNIIDNKYFYFSFFYIYKTIIDIMYIKKTCMYYGYLGRCVDFNIYKYLFGLVIFGIILIKIQNIKEKTIRFMVNCIFFLNGVTNISLYGLKNYDSEKFCVVILFWFILIMICDWVANFENTNTTTIKYFDNYKITKKLLIIGIIITLYLLIKYDFNIVDSNNLYMGRELFRNIYVPQIDKYLISWNAFVILPWCFYNFLISKNYKISILIFLLALIMFGITTVKTYLILYVAILYFNYFFKGKNFDQIINLMLLSSIIFILLSILFDSKILIGYIDRTFWLPGEINYYYLEFFSKRELLYLRESIFKWFENSPYYPWSAVQISHTYMEAAYYHNMTNGFIGDAYANFGILGIVIYPVLIGVTFWILKRSSNNNDDFMSLIIFLLIWSLINTSFFTWLMTGGYLMFICILNLHRINIFGGNGNA